MNFLRNNNSKKPAVAIFLAGALFLFLVVPNITHAVVGEVLGAGATYVISKFLPTIGSVTSTAVSELVFYLMYLVTSVVGFFIVIIAWMTEIILTLNEHIVDSSPVQAGFSISLAITNLGFVLAIVIIAITTILRRESYGMKQTLWRLLVAAALVNFGLVIAAPIIHFANDLTSYFKSPFGDTAGFRDALMESFAPQRFMQPGGNGDPFQNIKGAENVEGAAAGDQKGLLTVIISMFFTELMLVLILLTMVAFFVLLIIRYIALSILLILLPFVWLFWILPPLRSYLSRWWKMFFRWSFFAPIVMFFLYLAILAQRNMFSSDPDDAYAVLNNPAAFPSIGSSGPVLAAISSFLGDALTQPIMAGAQAAVVLGLVVGGLFAANSLSIHGADIALKAAKGVGSGFWNYARKGGPFRTFGRAAGGIAGSLTRPPSETAKGWRGTLQRPLNWVRRGLHTAATTAPPRVETYTDPYTGKTMERAIPGTERKGGMVSKGIIAAGQGLAKATRGEYGILKRIGERIAGAPGLNENSFLGSVVRGAAEKSGAYKKKGKKLSEQVAEYEEKIEKAEKSGPSPAATPPEQEETT